MLTKIRFDARMKETEKSLPSKSLADHALDLGNKNKEKAKKTKNFWFTLFPW